MDKDGRRLDVSLTVSPVRDASGGIIFARPRLLETSRTESALRRRSRKRIVTRTSSSRYSRTNFGSAARSAPRCT